METIKRLLVNQRRAHEIMGRNFFGVKEATEHFGVNPTRQQLTILSRIPFSEVVLEQSKDSHILVALFPISILEICDKINSKLFRDQSWHWRNKKFFTEKRDEVSWQLIRKTSANDSTLKNWQEQQSLFDKSNEIPIAQVMVYAISGYYLATSERIFQHIYVRTSSVTSNNHHVVVGFLVSEDLVISDVHDDFRNNFLGVSSAKIGYFIRSK